MRFKTVQGYVQVVVIGLLLAAGAILVILQWGNTASFSLYGKNVIYNTGGVVLVSVAAGAMLIPLMRWFIHGIKDIRHGRMQEKVDRIGELEKLQRKATAKAADAAGNDNLST